MHSSAMIAAFVAFLATAVSASPVSVPVEERSNLAQCWANGSDGSIWIPTNSVCQKAYTMPGYEYGTQNVPFGQTYISMASSPTTGPQHCCFRCESNANCVGWQINDDCTCQTWTSTVACPPAAGTFGHIGDASQNVTSVYHPSDSVCNA